MKLWGGRFEHGPAELFEQFSGSLDFDRRLLEADVLGSKAFASALASVGILTCEEREIVHRAFDEILSEAREADMFGEAEDEDIHTFVIRRLDEKAGALSQKIHTGRSRNEQVATDFRLWMKTEINAIQELLVGLMGVLLDFAMREPDALLPGYTHLRRAQPVLWAHYLLAYFEMFARDWQRFDDAYRRTDVLPLGSGALAGSGFPFDRQAMAEEFGFLELGDEVTSGSSLMPQKKNPDACELVRGKSGRVSGSLLSLMMTLKGLPLSYNRDLQEDKEPVFDAAAQLSGCLAVMKLTVQTAAIHPDRMEAAADESWVSATALAEELSKKGVPFHRAHQIVGKLVLESVRTGNRPQDWTTDELKEIASEFDDKARDLLTARSALSNHVVPGGTAYSVLLGALEEAGKRLEAMRRTQ